QIIHPEKYFSGELPRDVPFDVNLFKQNGWQPLVSTALGEIGVRGILLAGVDSKTALTASSGWGGDVACLFQKDGSKPLFVWRTVWDKQSDANEFLVAYKALMTHDGENLVSSS